MSAQVLPERLLPNVNMLLINLWELSRRLRKQRFGAGDILNALSDGSQPALNKAMQDYFGASYPEVLNPACGRRAIEGALADLEGVSAGLLVLRGRAPGDPHRPFPQWEVVATEVAERIARELKELRPTLFAITDDQRCKEFAALLEDHRHAYLEYVYCDRDKQGTALFAEVKRVESKLMDAYRAALQGSKPVSLEPSPGVAS